jgi:F0F1-type ATP synthase assembly protein I
LSTVKLFCYILIDYTKGGPAMMIVVEILGAAASIITIFSAGVAVGRILERKNDHP